MRSNTETVVNFPIGAELNRLLDLEASAAEGLEDLFAQSLTGPIGDFFARPRKNVRNQLVELGFAIASRSLGRPFDAEILKSSCEILEIFHAGSLVVDDIEDGSLYRRGEKSLHNLYGIPLALNAGNWLYFLPFKIIQDMKIDAERKAALASECQHTLLRAHYGQALDLGVSVECLAQERVAGVSMAAMELKAGVLTGLALSMGAIALGASPELTKRLNRFGRKAGIALQMFDDIGNLSSSSNPEKKCEDMKLKRVGYVFGVASRVLSSEDFARLIQLANELPASCEELLLLLKTNEVPKVARDEAETFLRSVWMEMKTELGLVPNETAIIEWLQSCLVRSYE